MSTKTTLENDCEGCRNNYPSLKDHSCANRATEYKTIQTLLSLLLNSKKITQSEFIRYSTQLNLEFEVDDSSPRGSGDK